MPKNDEYAKGCGCALTVLGILLLISIIAIICG